MFSFCRILLKLNHPLGNGLIHIKDPSGKLSQCLKDDGAVLKNFDHKDPNTIVNFIKKLENAVSQPLLDLERREDVKVKIRVDEKVGPAMFKADPFIPDGYIANSLTIRAMRPDIFVLGDSLEDLSATHECACGKEFDVQFWKICPYCARPFNL